MAGPRATCPTRQVPRKRVSSTYGVDTRATIRLNGDRTDGPQTGQRRLAEIEALVALGSDVGKDLTVGGHATREEQETAANVLGIGAAIEP